MRWDSQRQVPPEHSLPENLRAPSPGDQCFSHGAATADMSPGDNAADLQAHMCAAVGKTNSVCAFGLP